MEIFFSGDEGSRKCQEGPGADPRPPRRQVVRAGAHLGHLEVTLFSTTKKRNDTFLEEKIYSFVL